jgi:hypothetical protein
MSDFRAIAAPHGGRCALRSNRSQDRDCVPAPGPSLHHGVQQDHGH